MNERAHISILRRMAGQAADPVVPASPLTTSRAVRLALVKAASDAGNLVLDVASTGDDLGQLDGLLAALEPGLMLIGLQRGDALVGFVGVDQQLRAAVLEMKMMGRLLDHPAADRAATSTDQALCEPLLVAFMAALPGAVGGTAYAGWADGLRLAGRINDRRTAGLVLPDGDYRMVRMQVQLGNADRQGALLLALPMPVQAAPAPVPVVVAQDWHQTFPAMVQTAEACLTARLHRFKLPLRKAQAFAVGDIVALPGCSVRSVQLIAADGRVVAQGKLGQKSGKRALRIEVEQPAQLDDLPAVVIARLQPVADDPIRTGDAAPVRHDTGKAVPVGVPPVVAVPP